jgi:hypothetical protein
MDIDTAAELFTLLQYAFVGGVIGLPALGLTLRLGLKPLVDAVIRLREEFPPGSGGEIQALRRENTELRGELRALQSVRGFDAELLATSRRESGDEPR